MKTTIIILCGILAAAAGFGSGRAIFAADEETPSNGRPSGTIRLSGKSSGKGGAGPVVPPLGPEIIAEMIALKAVFDQGDLDAFFDQVEKIEDKGLRFQLLLEMAGSMSSEQFEQLFTLMVEENERIQELFDDEEMMILMIEPWVNKDPDAAIDFGLEQDDEGIMFSVIGLAFLAAKDYDAALAKLEEVKEVILEKVGEELGDSEEEFAQQIMMFGLSLNSPAEALRRSREENLEIEDLDMIFHMTNDVGPEVLTEIMKFEDPDRREELADEFFDVWKRKDPLAALEGFERYIEESGLPDDEAIDALESAQDDIFEEWARIDPDEAMKHLDLIKDKATRDSAFFEIAEAIVARSPEEAVAMVRESLPDDYRKQMLSWSMDPALKRQILDEMVAGNDVLSPDLISTNANRQPGPLIKLVQSDPAATTEWLADNLDALPGNASDDRAPRNNTGRAAGSSLAGASLDEAVTMLDRIPAGPFRDGFIDGLVEKGAQSDPLRTAEVVNGLGAEATEVVNDTLIRSWMGHQPEVAIHFAANLGEKELNRAIDSWANQDVAGALNWLTETENPAAVTFVADPDIHRNWIEQDAWAGADVTAALPAVNAVEATAIYMTQWANTAPAEASSYISDSMETGPVRDAAIVSLAAAIAPDDPAAARKWVMAITDPAMRSEALKALP